MEVYMLVLCLGVILPSLFLICVCFLSSFLPFAGTSPVLTKKATNLSVATSRRYEKVMCSLRGIEAIPHPFQCMSSSSVPSWLVTKFRVILPSQSLVSEVLILRTSFLSFVVGTSGAAVDTMQRDASTQASGGQNTIGSNEIIAISIGTVAIFASIGATVGVAIWQERRRRAASSLTLHNETDPESASGIDERSLVNDSDEISNSAVPHSLSLALHLEPAANLSQEVKVELDRIDGSQRNLGPAPADTQPPAGHSAATESPSVDSPSMLRIAP
ncbi:hypothetical protein PG991_011778 [Apiospora marii]|uniref:Uncharacterized protein n=1 Tax=Apiospora marii TaxID=335849 RepID=A0ABR1RGC0_9PEZI